MNYSYVAKARDKGGGLRLLAALVLSWALAVPFFAELGCRMCTEIGCADSGFEVVLNSPDPDTFNIDIKLRVDDEPAELKCFVRDDMRIDCGTGQRLGEYAISAFANEDASAEVVLSITHATDRDILGPEVVEIEIVRRSDQQTIVEQMYEPDYAVDEPNGPGCGVCEWAREIILVQ